MSMTRDTFPFEQDRYVIDLFLGGLPRSNPLSDFMHIENNRLMFQGRVFAWYDTAGALVCVPMPELASMTGYGNHLTNYILGRLGMGELRIVREITSTPGTHPAAPLREIKYFLDDQEIKPGAPVVLAGPLTMQAYRATQNNPTTVVNKE